MKAYFDKYPNSVAILYDSEFSVSPKYLRSFKIDPSRIIHAPIEHLEQLKFDIINRLNTIERGDRLFILVDSLGSLASKKEYEDALNEKSVSDMTRAKAIRSLLRLVTSQVSIKDIPCFMINHVYDSQDLFSKFVVSGGKAVIYSPDQVFIITRSKEKEGTEFSGYKFTINVEKSRFVKEKSKLSFDVLYSTGMNKYSGLMDLALESGICVKPLMGWYSKIDFNTGEIEAKKYRLKDTNTSEFWEPILKSSLFQNWVKNEFQMKEFLQSSNEESIEIIDGSEPYIL